MQFSPDGKAAVVGGQRKPLLHIDTATGKVSQPYPNQANKAAAGAYTPDGKQFVTAAPDGSLTVWDGKTFKESRRIIGPPPGLGTFGTTFLRLAAAGRTAAYTTANGTVRVVDLPTGRLLRQVENPSATWVHVLAFSPDGKTLAVVRERSVTVHLLDAITGKDRPASAGTPGAVGAVLFTPDGKAVVATAAHDVTRVIDVATRKVRATLGASEDTGGGGLAASADGKWLAVGRGTGVTVYDARTLRVERTHADTRSNNRGMSVAFSGDGRTVYASDPNRFLRLDATTGRPVPATDKWGDVGPAAQVAVAADGKTLAAAMAAGNVVKLLDPATGKERGPAVPVKPGAARLQFSPAGRLLAVAAGDTVTLWDADAGGPYGRWAADKGLVTAVAVRPDGRAAAVGLADGSLRLFATASGQTVRTLAGGHDGTVAAVAFAPDGKSLASGGADGTVMLWAVGDVGDLPAPGPTFVPAKTDLDAKRLQTLWADLAGDDATATLAAATLAAAPQAAVPFLRKQLVPVGADEAAVVKLIAKLNGDRKDREKAEADLAKAGPAAAAALRKSLAGVLTAEAKAAVEWLLARFGDPAGDGRGRQAARAVAVLEQIGTPEAVTVLHDAAKGAEPAAAAAKAALARRAKK